MNCQRNKTGLTMHPNTEEASIFLLSMLHAVGCDTFVAEKKKIADELIVSMQRELNKPPPSHDNRIV